MPLSSNEYKKLFEAIEVIHSAHDRSEMFHALCERLEGLIGISSAALVTIDPKSPNFHFPGHNSFNISSDAIFLFAVYYSALHPAVTNGKLNYLNGAVRTTDIIPASRLADTEYGRDFQPTIPIFYELSCALGYKGERFGGLTLHRTRQDRDFTDKHKDIFNLLIPHIACSLHNIDLKESITSALKVGVIVIRSDKRLLYMNDEAKLALGGRPVESIFNQGLKGGTTFYRNEKKVYSVHIIPQKTKKIIFLEPLSEREDLRQRLADFGLSRRQEEIALLVIHGLSNREIAEQLAITEQTVKDHMRNIFEKAHIRRRSELAIKVLGFRPAVTGLSLY